MDTRLRTSAALGATGATIGLASNFRSGALSVAEVWIGLAVVNLISIYAVSWSDSDAD